MAFRNSSAGVDGYSIDKDEAFFNIDASLGTPYNKTALPGPGTKITPSDGASGDTFGFGVAVGSGRIVVGALQDDDNGTDSGSAYVFDLEGNQLTKIIANAGGQPLEFFGESVAVGNGRIVVGAAGNDAFGPNTGAAYIFDLDGNPIRGILGRDSTEGDEFGHRVAVGNGRIVVGAPDNNDNGTSSGSAYIFSLDGHEITKILASDAASGDQFGYSVAVGSGRIVVGASGNDDNGDRSGSAYIFDIDGNEITKILASDGAPVDFFGQSVAVGSGRIVVGAPSDDDNGTSSGSAYIFDLDGNEITKILPSDGASGDNFGFGVAVGSGRIVVGALFNDDNGTNSGSTYIFDLDGNQLAKITASDAAAFDQFGYRVAAGSDRIVVSAPFSDDNGTNSGSAYIYPTNTTGIHYLDIFDD